MCSFHIKKINVFLPYKERNVFLPYKEEKMCSFHIKKRRCSFHIIKENKSFLGFGYGAKHAIIIVCFHVNSNGFPLQLLEYLMQRNVDGYNNVCHYANLWISLEFFCLKHWFCVQIARIHRTEALITRQLCTKQFSFCNVTKWSNMAS